MHPGQFSLVLIGAAILQFAAIILFQEFGWRLGRRKSAPEEKEEGDAAGLLDNAVFGLFGLLLGFTFSGSAARFDHRRELVAKVVNTTGTAWRRIEALPRQSQDSVRVPFRRYVDALLSSYQVGNLSSDVYRQPPAVTQAEDQTWAQAIKACLNKDGEQARMLLLPALDDMFGAVEEERLAGRVHPPYAIFVMFGLTALVTALLAGLAVSRSNGRGWVHRVGTALTISLAVYVILEMEYPRLGLIRVYAMDQALVDLRATMK